MCSSIKTSTDYNHMRPFLSFQLHLLLQLVDSFSIFTSWALKACSQPAPEWLGCPSLSIVLEQHFSFSHDDLGSYLGGTFGWMNHSLPFKSHRREGEREGERTGGAYPE